MVDNATMALTECRPCPAGSDCALPGVTSATLSAAPGYWRSSNTSMDFVRCLRASHCAGGLSSGCLGNRAGTLCAACQEGYRASSYTSNCSKCPEKESAVATTVVISLLLLGLICFGFYLVWSSESSLNLASRASMFITRRIRREAVRAGRIAQQELSARQMDEAAMEEEAKQESKVEEWLRNPELFDPHRVFLPEMRMPTKFT